LHEQSRGVDPRAAAPIGAPGGATGCRGELEQELEEARQQVLYAQAETQNVRRRLEQEKQNAQAYAATGFARDMLSVKDNLERALAAMPEESAQDERIKA
jgi:molecular chaperone GrpE